jgi:hypothetical protein
MRQRPLTLAGLVVVLVAVAWSAGPAAERRGDLPDRLSDQEFWRLTEELSEPNGYFRSDNLLSNEQVFARIVPELVSRTKPGGVYLGVGPEQNFTYIAAMKPKMAFIIDIRRGNLHLHLMYKALFELSADRAEFLGRLFTRTRPEGLTPQATAGDLFQAYGAALPASDEVYRENLRAIEDVLVKKHKLPLPPEDLSGIDYVYRAFFTHGPSITWSTNIAANRSGRGVTYAGLMTQTDQQGQELGYLSSEERYRLLKDLEGRNLIVPVVGDFGGPKAIRAVGTYLRDRGAIVSAFYLSNVEQYLRQDSKTAAFCRNSAALPLDEASVFIRPGGSVTFVTRGGTFYSGAGAVPPGTGVSTMYLETARRPALFPIAEEVRNCGAEAPMLH